MVVTCIRVWGVGGANIQQLNYLSGLLLGQMASVSTNVIFAATSESLGATARCHRFTVFAHFIHQSAVSWRTLRVVSAVCLLSRRRSPFFSSSAPSATSCLRLIILHYNSSFSFILFACLHPPLVCHHVFAPDASCLSSMGCVSVMDPSRNSKHHSGIFFQAIAFCSNKGGVASALPS